MRIEEHTTDEKGNSKDFIISINKIEGIDY